ncbi:hypothetical protein ACTXT7_008856 [Hymenolepis weldensis]
MELSTMRVCFHFNDRHDSTEMKPGFQGKRFIPVRLATFPLIAYEAEAFSPNRGLRQQSAHFLPCYREVRSGLKGSRNFGSSEEQLKRLRPQLINFKKHDEDTSQHWQVFRYPTNPLNT